LVRFTDKEVTTMPSIIAFSMPGPGEWIVIAILGLLIFGKRLPEVGRSLGRGIVEFKKGLKGVEDEIEQATAEDNAASARELPPAGAQHKFDPYTGKPLQPRFDPHTGKPLESADSTTSPVNSQQT
jgi:sec-independent protein translocase protein TatA